jgi:hypothetical protein
MTERKLNLIGDGIDVALRFGDLQDDGAIARKLGKYRHQLVASPAYLALYGEPSQPAHLLTRAVFSRMACSSHSA